MIRLSLFLILKEENYPNIYIFPSKCFFFFNLCFYPSFFINHEPDKQSEKFILFKCEDKISLQIYDEFFSFSLLNTPRLEE